MGSIDKNSTALHLPITTCGNIIIVQEDSVIWWHLLMKDQPKIVNASGDKNFEQCTVDDVKE